MTTNTERFYLPSELLRSLNITDNYFTQTEPAPQQVQKVQQIPSFLLLPPPLSSHIHPPPVPSNPPPVPSNPPPPVPSVRPPPAVLPPPHLDEVEITDSEQGAILHVPTTSIPWVIGKKGRHVNKLQVDWNVFIQIKTTKDNAISHITVFGDTENRQTCAIILKGKIEYFLRRHRAP